MSATWEEAAFVFERCARSQEVEQRLACDRRMMMTEAARALDIVAGTSFTSSTPERRHGQNHAADRIELCSLAFVAAGNVEEGVHRRGDE